MPFPAMSISVDDFGIAIERLHGTWHELKDQSDWGNVQIMITVRSDSHGIWDLVADSGV